MGSGYTGEPHDGVYAMSRYVRRVSLENDKLPATIMNLKEMRPLDEKPFIGGTPVLKKADFIGALPGKGEGYLLLKSGGSSGKSIYAPHSYADALTTYITAGRAMFTAGITAGDVVMNLFYSGSMYGGFISMYEGLKHIDAIQLPMSSIMDFEFVTGEITANNVNSLMGMPSYLFNLFSEQRDALKKYARVEKLFYGGEHMSPKQMSWYKEEFGIKSIKSLVYGCNEIGSIGYVCEYCEGSEHHLFDTMYMEILKMDSDESVDGTEPGRIILTPFDKENIDINRYEIGDLGRFTAKPCPCGRAAPKFELLGRFGDTFRFASNYVNYNQMKSILAEIGYAGNLQILLEHTENTGQDSMKIFVDKGADTKAIMDVLAKRSPEINESVSDKTGIVSVEATDKENFIMSSAGGKVRNVVDVRL
jgi:phenylacetate-coenzyme A ligase PaaK-like adenylate-forming protein